MSKTSYLTKVDGKWDRSKEIQNNLIAEHILTELTKDRKMQKKMKIRTQEKSFLGKLTADG